MLVFHESDRITHRFVPRGAVDLGYLGPWKKSPAASGATCANHPYGGRRNIQSGDYPRDGDLSPYGAALAGALLGPSPAGSETGCAPSWPHSKNSGTKNPGCGQSDPAHNASRCDALEYASHGRIPRAQRSDDPSNMEAAQPQASLGQNLQTQPRQALHRETVRCRWPVSESSGQVPGFVRGRKEPNSGPRQDPTRPADEERPLRDHDPRLQTPWHYHLVCGPQYARWQSDRGLYATPSAPRVHSFPQENRWRNPVWACASSDRGQLRYAQAPAREILAQTASSVPSALYPDLEFLVESDRALVPRDHRQAYPSR